jgi:hypothetical protein
VTAGDGAGACVGGGLDGDGSGRASPCARVSVPAVDNAASTTATVSKRMIIPKTVRIASP